MLSLIESFIFDSTDDVVGLLLVESRITGQL